MPEITIVLPASFIVSAWPSCFICTPH